MEKVETLKSCSIFKNKLFLILFIISNLYSISSLDKGDEFFVNKQYKKAIKYYMQVPNRDKMEIKLRLIQCYLRLGDNYYKIQSYDTALTWYEKAKKLNSRISLIKIGELYEKQADQYNKIHKYEKALELYSKATQFKNKNVMKKIETIEKKLSHQTKLTKDTRVEVNKNSPVWTHTIGRLIIPTNLEFSNNKSYKTKIKKCSATLVNLDKNSNSNTIITASHCLNAYNKKAGQLKFIIKDKNNKMIFRIAKIEFDSKFHIKKLKTTTDFAILSLNRTILKKNVQAFTIKKDSFSSLQKKYKNSFGSLGGFSSDIAAYGAKLTYDPKCKLSAYSKTYGYSNCKGFKGASGGPIILTTINNHNKKIQHHFVGVVSHFKNKDFTNIFFAPHHIFYNEIKRIINL